MRENKCRYFLISLFIITPIISKQVGEGYDSVIRTIEKQGFENLQIKMENSHIKIAYENRVYRSEMNAMGSILTTILNSDIADSVSLTPMNKMLPLTAIGVNLDDFSSFLKGNTDNTTFSSQISVNMVHGDWDEVENIPVLNPSSKRLEVTINPGIEALFHTNQGPAIWKLNLIPKVSYSFRKGTQLVFEGIIPLSYQFHEETKQIKLGSVYISYMHKLNNTLWTSTTMGVFPWKTAYRGGSFRDFYRYGISNETAKFYLNGKINLSMKLDYTAHLDYLDGVWGYYSASSGKFTWRGNLGYRFNKQDIHINLGHGKNLYEKSLTELKITRSFREIDIGFHARWNEGDEFSHFTLGLRLDIPVPFFQIQNNAVILNSFKRFWWEFSYHDNPQGGFPKTKTSVLDFQKRMYPSYIKNNTELFLKNIDSNK